MHQDKLLQRFVKGSATTEAAILINLIRGQSDLVLFSGFKDLRWIYTSSTEMGCKKKEFGLGLIREVIEQDISLT